MRESDETKPVSKLSGPLNRVLQGSLLIGAGVLLGSWLIPKPAPEVLVRTQIEYKDRVQVVYKDRVVYKEKVITKPDGTRIEERTNTEEKTKEKEKTKERRKEDSVVVTAPRPRYILGLQYDPVQTNGHAMVGIRLADLPIYLTAGVIAPRNLGFGLGIAVEIP